MPNYVLDRTVRPKSAMERLIPHGLDGRNNYPAGFYDRLLTTTYPLS